MVPFEKIGPGQSIRLAWQIMGKDGPIPNPAGIRYLPADVGSVTNGAQNLLNASTALAGLNLMATVSNNAIAAQTLQELRKVSKRVEELAAVQGRIEEKVEKAIATIKRVEIGVSEARLARVVSNALRAAREEDGLNFEPFQQLAEDLQSFLDDAGIARGKVTNLRIGSDVRGDLNNIVSLLRGVRVRIASQWNRHHEDPCRVWRCDQLDDYWSDSEIAAARIRAAAAHDAAVAVVCSMASAHRSVNQCFSFNGSDDHSRIQASLIEDAFKPMWLSQMGVSEELFRESVAEMEQVAMQRLRISPSAVGATVWLNDQFLEGYLEAAAYLAVVDSNMTSQDGQIPAAVFFLPNVESPEDMSAALRDFRRWWLYSTDDGIVYRAWLECAAVAHGYTEVWPDLTRLVEGVTEALPQPDPVLVDIGAEDRTSNVPAQKAPRRFR